MILRFPFRGTHKVGARVNPSRWQRRVFGVWTRDRWTDRQHEATCQLHNYERVSRRSLCLQLGPRGGRLILFGHAILTVSGLNNNAIRAATCTTGEGGGRWQHSVEDEILMRTGSNKHILMFCSSWGLLEGS